LCILPATASAEWIDQFDQYLVGSNLPGQGGWAGWDNDPAAGALVSNLFSRSPGKSVEITGASDLVHPYTGYTSGSWIYTAWVYIPSGFSGASDFLILNTYNHGGPYNWSAWIEFDSSTGLVNGYCGSWTPQTPVAYKFDQWTKISVEIFLEDDWTKVYYDGMLFDDPALADHPALGGGYGWTFGCNGAGGGQLNIGTVDLFANGASPVYYDDLALYRGHGWYDDIEAYANGSQIVGQGGWEEWGTGAGALVSNAQAHSGSNSIDISGGTDLIYQYEGYTSSIVKYTAFHYIPTGFSGRSYFIMLDKYDAGGPYNWAVQFYFDSTFPPSGKMGGWFGGPETQLFDLFYDAWYEINVIVDMDADWCDILYNGSVVAGYQWSKGYNGSGTVSNNIGALDLFANGASTIYYDDIAIGPMVPVLKGDSESFSETTAGVVNFVLNTGFQHANRNYVILMGISGVEPGTPLLGGETLNLNWDIVTGLGIALIPTPIMTNFYGTTDNIGVATATFDTIIPIGTGAGITLYFAGTTMNPFDYPTNHWAVRILP
jgi:hypothetical protein